ncbi:Cell division inhibitor SulA [Novipirellula galeiformis]|uniref:Cell division inhibitor SulA n=1 Tax=Novipirellula galeiformis TaxID=2528004 RepID=A0A5C6CLW2_9BACT|nr:hypothetical protein [Novipirellula galeiformis]TWU24136.1 Cell division inhibitor SulA [Novipirellula galeiformis]
MPQQTFEFMEASASAPPLASSQPIRSKANRRSQGTPPLRTPQRPGLAIGKSSLLFPLEPYVRSAPKRAASGLSSHLAEAPPKTAENAPSSLPSEAPLAPVPPSDRQTILEKLRAQANCLNVSSSHPMEAGPTLANHAPIFSTGCVALDHTLLRGGLRGDAISEWIADAEGCGAAALSLVVAGNALRAHDQRLGDSTSPIVIIDSRKTFYPPAAIALGIPATRMILVQPRSGADAVWAIDQALRCEAVAAVWAMIDTRLDDRDARRFQLAAEQGHTPGFFVRPVAERGKPSFAEVRLHVKKGTGLSWPTPPNPHHDTPLQVTLDRGRGGPLGKSVWIQMDDQAQLIEVAAPLRVAAPQGTRHETAAVHLASQLAHPKRTAARSVNPQHRVG